MTLNLFLFHTGPTVLAATCDPDRPADEQVDALVVDWEREGKEHRQAEALRRIGTDTQISVDTPADLARVRAFVTQPVICRINHGPTTAKDVETAVRLGADEVLLPMVRFPLEVEAVLQQAKGRVGVGVMIETAAALRHARQIGRLPITRAYVGLMDLALDRNSPTIFAPLLDGLLDEARAAFEVPFGFGGLTLPGRGTPLPTLLLLGEMSRLGCQFTFLRRSFLSDTAASGVDPGGAVAAIRKAARRAEERSAATVASDHRRLLQAVRRLEPTREVVR